MGRPRNEQPPLRQRGDVWYATVYVGGRAVERSTGERSEAKAARVAASWEQEAAAAGREAAARASNVTLNDVLSELLDDTRAKIRNGNRSEETFDFYEKKAGSLLAFFGHDFDVSAWSKDSKASWDYIRWRRSSKVTDSSIKKELGTLRTALYLGQEQGLFGGNPALAIPASFTPETKAADRSPTREEFLALVPYLHPDAAAITSFILATSAEVSALKRARRADLPAKVKDPFTVHVRGSKTDDRDRQVPIVTDEQVALLAFAARHAGGKGEALFSRARELQPRRRRSLRRGGGRERLRERLQARGGPVADRRRHPDRARVALHGPRRHAHHRTRLRAREARARQRPDA